MPRPVTRTLCVVLSATVAGFAHTDCRAQEAGLYSLPRTQDDLAELELAREELRKGQAAAAAERLHGLLDAERHGVVPVLGGIDRFEGVRHAVIRELGNLPNDGEDAYSKLVARRAGHLRDRPLETLRTEELLRAARGFPTTDLGVAARLRLGDLALERGDAAIAQQHYRAVADVRANLESLSPRRDAARLLGARVPAHVQPASSLDARRIDALVPYRNSGRWPAYGGGGDGAVPMLEPIGRPVEIGAYPIHALGFLDHVSRPNPYPMHAVGDLGGIYVNNGIAVWSIDPLAERRDEHWRAEGPMADITLAAFEEVAESINPDTVLSCAIDDRLVVAPLMVPNDVVGASETQSFKASINIIRKMASRRLFAFDRETGKLVWAHWDTRDGPTSKRFDGHDVCGPPLIDGDTIYVATHDQTGAIAYYLSAYDVHTGEPRWRRLICSSGQEVNMFGNARQEFAAAPLALHEGVVYGATNLGVCFAANAEDGHVRWVTGYQTIPLPPTRLRDQQSRQVYFSNSPPAITAGVMACTPLDSQFAIGLDLETGRILWELPHASRRGEWAIRWLLGALGDEFVFSGIGLVAVQADADTRRNQGGAIERVIASPAELGEANGYRVLGVPRSALSDDRIWYLGGDRTLQVLDARGQRDTQQSASIAIRDVGNLVLVDGIAVVCRSKDVALYADLEQLVQAAERRVRAEPLDLLAHQRLCRVALATTSPDADPVQINRSIQVFERALTAAAQTGLGEGSPLFRTFADGHFDLTLRQARRVVQRDPRAGANLLIACRDAARTRTQWIDAQLELLATLRGQRLVDELDQLRARYGAEEHRFPQIGRVPVAAYCIWTGIPHVAPEAAALRCQELLERFPEVQFGDRLLRELAVDALRALIRAHGVAIYAPIERAAQAEFERAGDDRSALASLAARFPHSAAASRASERIIDLAVEAGDLATAIRIYAAAENQKPGTTRRLMLAAVKAGNLPLAHSLGSHLAAAHAGDVSDYHADGGKTYAAIIAELPELPTTPVARSITKPQTTLGQLMPPNTGTTLTHQPTEHAPGFALSMSVEPLFVVVDERELRGFMTREWPSDVDEADFVLGLHDAELDSVVLCGDLAVVAEHRRIRGVELADGNVRWSLEAPARRNFTNLGVHDGLLILYSSLLTGGDGGELLAIEPLSGSTMYERRLPPTRDSFVPSASVRGIWYWEPSPRPTIVRVDPLSGVDALRIELPDDALRFLGLGGVGDGSMFRVHNIDLQTHIVPHDDFVVIPVDAEDDDARARCIAVGLDGRTRWTWSGGRGQILQMAAPFGDQTVLVAHGNPSAFSVLDRHGQQKRGRELGVSARIHNWRRNNGAQPAPDVLVISDTPAAPNVTCISLVADKPFFAHRLTDAFSVLGEPLPADGFVAIPVRARTAARLLRARIVQIDYANPHSSAQHVPDSDSLFNLPMQIRAHGTAIVVENPDGLHFLGSAERTNR